MTVANTLDLLYFVLTIAVMWVGAMLAWLIYEAALMLHRANRTIKGAIDKLNKFERAVTSIKERVESSSGYLGAIAEGGRLVMNMMEKRGKKKRRRDEDE